jgi:hypothetical protein
MKYDEQTAQELAAKYNIPKSTVYGWRRRRLIPEMYAKNELEKIKNQLGKPRNGGGRPPTGRTGKCLNFYIPHHLAEALSKIDINKTKFVAEAVREKLNREIKRNPKFAEILGQNEMEN